MHSAHIGEAASGVADGEGLYRLTLEEKQPRVRFCGVSRFFLICVDAVKNGVARLGVGLHVVGDLHRLAGVNVAVPSQMQLPQGVAAVIAVMYREDQSAVVPKGRIVDYIRNLCIPGVCGGFSQFRLAALRTFALHRRSG